MQKLKIINGKKYYAFKCKCFVIYIQKVFVMKSGELVEDKVSNKICKKCMNKFSEVMENE